MKLYIKNMKCARCRFLVKSELEKLGLRDISIKSGEVLVNELFPDDKLLRFKQVIKDLDLEITVEKDSILVEKIKRTIEELVTDPFVMQQSNFSDRISKRLGYNYNYLSNKFSAVAGISIKKYIIQQKIFKVKEMLMHDDLSLSEISDKMSYCNIAHLSAQFKKETGMTPSGFRKRHKAKTAVQ
jgi:YesN/AraC family two-component response regulator